MRNALIRYRVMAYVVGVLLIVLTCVGMPLKYVWGNDSVVTATGDVEAGAAEPATHSQAPRKRTGPRKRTTAAAAADPTAPPTDASGGTA